MISRISEFCGLTINDIDLENGIVNIDHQLLRDSASNKYIQSTKTNAGTRKLPIKEDVRECINVNTKMYKSSKIIMYNFFNFQSGYDL